MHRYSTPGLYGLNDLMAQVSIRNANLTWHKRSRPSKEYRLLHVVELVSPMLHGKSHYHLYILNAKNLAPPTFFCIILQIETAFKILKLGFT